MCKTRKLLVVLSLLFPITLMGQMVYYVSSSEGDDTNTGDCPARAWQSLTMVNSFIPAPGDQILFRKGDVWEGAITVPASGTYGSPIIYGAYGTGDKPKIYGSRSITDWTLHSGNIYKATVSSSINQLFLDDAKMKVARYPNAGYFYINAVGSSTQFTSNNLDTEIDYAGAVWVGRTQTWALMTKTVTASGADTVILNSAPTYDFGVNEGFILLNKLEFLDQAGEWYYDESTSTIYFWTPNNDSPANYTIRGSVVPNVVDLADRNYVNIENLEVLHSSDASVVGSGGSNITIDNCRIYGSATYGILMTSSPYTNVSNSDIGNVNYDGVRLYQSNNCEVTDNYIHNIALFEDIGITGTKGHSNGTGMTVSGSHSIIRYNRIIRTAYHGISFCGIECTIEYNYLNDICLTIGDGGGIYTFSSNYGLPGSAGSNIEHNIIDNVIGNAEGYAATYNQGAGIYIDNNIHHVSVKNNLVAHCTVGIWLHDNGLNTADGNTAHDCLTHFLIQGDKGEDYNTLNNNIGVASDREGSFIWWGVSHQRMVTTSGTSFAYFDNNQYVHHYRSSGIFNNLTFPDWQSATGQDANSTFDGSVLTEGETEKLFYNDTKQPKVFDLGNFVYRDLDGNPVVGELSLESFTSKILIKTDIASNSSSLKKPTTEISIYPNPTNGKFIIQANDLPSDVCKISLFNMMGNQVLKQQFSRSDRVPEETKGMKLGDVPFKNIVKK